MKLERAHHFPGSGFAARLIAWLFFGLGTPFCILCVIGNSSEPGEIAAGILFAAIFAVISGGAAIRSLFIGLWLTDRVTVRSWFKTYSWDPSQVASCRSAQYDGMLNGSGSGSKRVRTILFFVKENGRMKQVRPAGLIAGRKKAALQEAAITEFLVAPLKKRCGVESSG